MSRAANLRLGVAALSLLTLSGILTCSQADTLIPTSSSTNDITSSGHYVVNQDANAGNAQANAGVRNRVSGTSLTNHGTISGSDAGLYVMSYGMISVTNGSTGIISGAYDGISLSGASTYIGALTNQGAITSTHGSGDNYGVYNPGTIGAFFNTGRISGSAPHPYGIQNDGTITTLTNGQADLTYRGQAPGRYNTYFTSASSYGKTRFSLTGSTLTYGLDKASGVAYATGTYYNVVSSTHNALTITDASVSGVIYNLVRHRGSTGYTCSVAACYDLVITAIGNGTTKTASGSCLYGAGRPDA